MHLLRQIIEARFGMVLLVACIAGLLIPMDNVPDSSASWALAMLTYTSCFKLRDGGFADINWRHIIRFYIVRFLILPMLLFAAAHFIVPEYALGIFLLALLPSAVSTPAFAHMFGGHVPPAFAIVIISTLLAPFLIPLQFVWASDLHIHISPYDLFKTLVFCIFIPMLAYAATLRFRAWGDMMYDNVKLISILLVFFVIVLIISKQRHVILHDPFALVIPLICCWIFYAICILCGSWLGKNQSTPTRISYTTCSAFNNVALGVSLALLHFPPNVVLLVAASEIGWAMMPFMMKVFIASLPKDASAPPAP